MVLRQVFHGPSRSAKLFDCVHHLVFISRRDAWDMCAMVLADKPITVPTSRAEV